MCVTSTPSPRLRDYHLLNPTDSRRPRKGPSLPRPGTGNPGDASFEGISHTPPRPSSLNLLASPPRRSLRKAGQYGGMGRNIIMGPTNTFFDVAALKKLPYPRGPQPAVPVRGLLTHPTTPPGAAPPTLLQAPQGPLERAERRPQRRVRRPSPSSGMALVSLQDNKTSRTVATSLSGGR